MKSILLSLLLVLCAVIRLNAQEPKSTPTPPQSAGGGAAAAEPLFHMVRSVSGTKITQDTGRLVVEDPRTVFYAPADKEIIVYFTWEGPTGPHHFEGLWRNPSGRVSITSEFDYKVEQRRFGGYFKMLPGETPSTGLWTLEVRIDGEAAGTHTFEVVNAARPDNISTKSTRRPLGPSEIYNRAAAASVLVENVNSKGARRNVGTGFFIGPSRLLTAFQVIDGAAKVRIVGPQNQLIEMSEVVSFNRRQDWIIFNVPVDNMPALARDVSSNAAIGDRAYFLDVPAEGNRVLVETTLTGRNKLGTGGDRYNIADTTNKRAIGSPLLNEYGEVIGFIGGDLLPGSAFLGDLAFEARSNALGMTSRGTNAVPISLVNDSSSAATTIEGLLKAGQFMPPLVNTQSVLSGVLARTVNKKAIPPQPIDERIEFSRANPQGVLLLTWLPKEKRKGYPALRIYDLDNQLLSEFLNKKKITVDANKLSYSLWELNFAPLQPGIYRMDVLLDGDFVWRTFFRLVE